MRFYQDAKDAWSVKLQGLESSLEAGELMQYRASFSGRSVSPNSLFSYASLQILIRKMVMFAVDLKLLGFNHQSQRAREQQEP